MKCLIVEDDLMSRYMLKELLPSTYDIDIAVTGEEAIESFNLAYKSKRPYALIFMDIEMPGLNGYEASKRIREIERELEVPPRLEVKIIMLTANDSPKMVVDSLNKAGATSYLVKPIGKQKLMLELKKCGLAT